LVGSFSGHLLGGFFGDVYGRKPIYAISIGIIIVASLGQVLLTFKKIYIFIKNISF
jgi:MFS family permease